MSEACGLAVIPVYKMLKDPGDAPEPFMIAMADADENGLHFYLSREALVKFANDCRKLVYDT